MPGKHSPETRFEDEGVNEEVVERGKVGAHRHIINVPVRLIRPERRINKLLIARRKRRRPLLESAPKSRPRTDGSRAGTRNASEPQCETGRRRCRSGGRRRRRRFFPCRMVATLTISASPKWLPPPYEPSWWIFVFEVRRGRGLCEEQPIEPAREGIGGAVRADVVGIAFLQRKRPIRWGCRADSQDSFATPQP